MIYIKQNLMILAPFFLISIPFVIIHRLLEIKKRHYLGIKITKYGESGEIALMYSFILIVTVTLGTSIYSFSLPYISQHIYESLKNINLIPFKGMIEFGVHGFVNILGNIFIYIPLGFCASLFYHKEKRTKHIILEGAIISLVIEIIQIFIIRSMDINDIMLNTLGAFLGLKLLVFFEKRFPNFFNKFNIKKPINKLTLRNKSKYYIITILQTTVWIVMCFNIKYMIQHWHF
ncbi:VanZ family protein [Clostridium estertheticum]|uniref:VanZ family protein n=1 Tax=Clostridium estertheticum TaxID=238834 RepID=UPI001C0DB1E6|nr:VanZ family protein [Clostridium estertheticum]MBU3076030.1 VanZ family protein [Clostridium estertheticum]MBU3166150.1 VanZ family protein [Clostridium estertheticum]